MSKEPVYNVITTASQFTYLVDKFIETGEEFGFDIETGYVGEAADGIALLTNHPNWIFVGFSLSQSDDSACYVPIAHDDETQNADDPVQIARDLWRLLSTGLAIAHNAAFELRGTGRWLREMLSDDPVLGSIVNADYGIFPVCGDSQLLAFVMDKYYGEKIPNKNGNLVTVGKDLKSSVQFMFDENREIRGPKSDGYRMIQFDDLFTHLDLKKKNHARFNMLPVNATTVKYACEDALFCLKLYKILRAEALEDMEDGTYDDRAYQIEMQLLPVVARMDQRGIPLDWEYMQIKLKEAEELQAKMNEEIMKKISDELNEPISINLNSPKQVAEILYERLGVKRPKERGQETNSTAEKALQAISKGNSIVRDILTYRTVQKMIGSYLKKYITTLNYKEDGRAYPGHNATGAISGRFSVDGMSYQQLPKPYYYKLDDGTEFHLAFREIIQAPENYRIVGFDYSQIQLRMMAGFAQEKNMLSAFHRGVDIHTATASSMLGVPVDKVTGKQRSIGKTLNFGIVFQQGPDALAESLTSPEEEVTKEDAIKKLQQYYEGFPSLRAWMTEQQQLASAKKYVTGLWGRRYYIWEMKSDLPGIQAKGLRTAINEPIQGAEALYAKQAMINADKAIREAGLEDKIQLVIMIHDALEFFVHDSIDTQTVIDLLGDAVSYPIEGHDNFPEISSDWHEGPSLGSLVEIELDENKKIAGYNMKMEVSGSPTVKWEGDTFDEVFDKFTYWRKHNHPENKGKDWYIPLEEEAPKVDPKSFEIIVSKLDKKNLTMFMKLCEHFPGENELTLIYGSNKVKIPVKTNISLKHKVTLTKIFDSVVMYETNEEEVLPF